MRRTLEYQEARSKKRVPKKTLALLGAIGVGFLTGQVMDKSGDLEQVSPKTPIVKSSDQTHTQLSWNMHNETKQRTGQLKKLIKQNEVDAALLQEVSRDDFRYLAKKLPEYYMSYVMADAKSQPTSGGFGNVIITEQKPKDVKTISLSGSGIIGGFVRLPSGVVEDVAQANPTLDSTRKSFLADRSALSLTIQVGTDPLTKDIRIINSHIEGDPSLNKKHFSKLLSFVF